jgi:hypothetical protein
MSYNTAENYPLPFGFNDGDTGDKYVKPRNGRPFTESHPIALLKVGEAFHYEVIEVRKFNHVLIRMRKIGKKFENDRFQKTYTRIL